MNFRFEKAIANQKPTEIGKTDLITNFWAVNKKVADEYDNNLVSKYAKNLNTSLLLVSTSSSPVPLIFIPNHVLFLPVGGFILGRHCHDHCLNRFTTPAEYCTWRNQPACTRLENLNQGFQSSIHPQ